MRRRPQLLRPAGGCATARSLRGWRRSATLPRRTPAASMSGRWSRAIGAPGRHAGRAQAVPRRLGGGDRRSCSRRSFRFLERTIPIRAPPPRCRAVGHTQALNELRERHERVAQIIVDAEAAPALVHASSRVIAPTVHDAQPIQRRLDAPRQRLQKYATMLGSAAPAGADDARRARRRRAPLRAMSSGWSPASTSPLAAFLDEQLPRRFVFADEAARRHGGESRSVHAA